MQAVDLAIGDARLEARSLSLGWKKVFAPEKTILERREEFKKLFLPQKILFASAQSGELLRKAAATSNPSSLLLLDPFQAQNFQKDDGLVRAVAQSAGQGRPVLFAIPLSHLLRSSFVYRARFVAGARGFAKKCLKFGAPFAVVSNASSEWELKSPREAVALASLFGLSEQQARASVSDWPARALKQFGFGENK